MSSVTRRTTVRESTMTKRKQPSRMAKGAHKVSDDAIDSNKLDSTKRHYSASVANFKEKDYFERSPKTDYTYGDSGTYRVDCIGKPWRSPNMSRRSIFADYAGSPPMQSHHTTVLYRNTKDDEKASSSIQTHPSITPISLRELRSTCQHSGGTGVICSHADCLTCKTESTTRESTHTMYGHWNTDSNNSALQLPSQKSSSGRTSAVSRITLWRTESDNVNSSERERNRRGGKKQVSSIYGLDEASESRVTRSRVKRLETANHISTTKEEQLNSSSSLSSNVIERRSFWSISRNIIYFITSIFRSIFYAAKNVGHRRIERMREVQQYYGVPLICVPFIEIIQCILFVLLLPVRIFKSLSCFRNTSNSTEAVSSTEISTSNSSHEKLIKSTRTRYSACSPCLLWIISAIIAVVLLLLILSFSPGSSNQDTVFTERIKKHKTWEWVLLPIHFVRTVMLSLICGLYSLYHGLICCSVAAISCFWHVIGSMRQTVTIGSDYVASYIRSKPTDEIITPAEWRTNIPSKLNGDSAKDDRFNEILAALQAHDKILRKQEQALIDQQGKVQMFMETLTNSEQATGELRAALGRVEDDISTIQTRTTQIETTLLELKHWRSKISESADKNFVVELTSKQQEATASQLRRINALIRHLRVFIEREGRAAKAKLRRHEETLMSLSLHTEKLETDMKKTVPPSPDVDRLVREVTSGHQRITTLQTKLDDVEKLIATLQTDHAKKIVQQEWTQKEMEEDSKKGTSGSGCSSILGCVKRLTVRDVQRLIDEALDIFAADRIARPDFALESGGGSIIGTRCTSTYTDRPAVISIFGIPLFRLSRSPRSVIQPAIQPGECWAFRGSKGQLVVRLANDVVITAVTIEHIPKSLSPNGRIDSAPREFEVKGLESESDFVGWSLGQYEFRADGPPLQTFAVQPLSKSNDDQKKRTPPSAFRYVELLVLSNHGHAEYTCIYRLRVHGNVFNENDVKKVKEDT